MNTGSDEWWNQLILMTQWWISKTWAFASIVKLRHFNLENKALPSSFLMLRSAKRTLYLNPLTKICSSRCAFQKRTKSHPKPEIAWSSRPVSRPPSRILMIAISSQAPSKTRVQASITHWLCSLICQLASGYQSLLRYCYMTKWISGNKT